MTKKHLTPAAAAIGAAMAGTLAMGTAAAADNPFGLSDLDRGYMVLASNEGEGKCGGEMKTMEGKCGEGKCGDNMQSGTAAPDAEEKAKEGKCGEGKCGGNK